MKDCLRNMFARLSVAAEELDLPSNEGPRYDIKKI